MAGENTTATLDGLHKTVFGDKVERLIPSWAKFQTACPFSERYRTGKLLEIPVILAAEGGITCAEPEEGPFSIQPPIAGQIKPSQVKPYSHCSRSAISYDTAFNAGPSDENSKQAYENAAGLIVQNLMESQRRQNEGEFLGYGRDGWGRVASIATNVLTITDANWAAARWVGKVGHKIEVFSTNVAAGTKRAGAGSDTLGTGYYTITAVDVANKKITVDDATNIVANDYIYCRTQKTATVFKTLTGLKQILTTVGTLFGIVNTTFDLYQGNSYTVGGNLSVPHLLRALALVAPKGGAGEFTCWVSPITYAVMNSDVASLVRFDGTKAGKYVIGSDSIEIRGSIGTIKLEVHEMVSEGDGFLWQPKTVIRSGTTDVTFDRSRINNTKGIPSSFYRELADAAGYELRCWDQQFIHTAFPGRGVFLSGITNT